MSSRTLTVITCDRCAFEETRKPGDGKGEWTRWTVVKADGRVVVGHSEDQADDLCPGCSNELLVWLGRVSSPTEQPEASPRAQAAAFAAADRLAAIDRADTLLRAQAYDALAAAREEPAGVLAGEIPVDAVAATPGRAAELVDSIVALLRPKKTRAKSGKVA